MSRNAPPTRSCLKPVQRRLLVPLALALVLLIVGFTTTLVYTEHRALRISARERLTAAARNFDAHVADQARSIRALEETLLQDDELIPELKSGSSGISGMGLGSFERRPRAC